MSGFQDGKDNLIRPSDGNYPAFYDGQRAGASERAGDDARMANQFSLEHKPSPPAAGGYGGGDAKGAGILTVALGIAMTAFGLAGLNGDLGNNEDLNFLMGWLFAGSGAFFLVIGVLVWRQRS